MLSGIRRESLVGLPVVGAKISSKIGTVLDVLFTPGRKKIDGIMITGSGKYPRNFFIARTNILAIGQHAVIVDDFKIALSESAENRSIKKGIPVNKVVGLPVLRDDGQEVGTVSDIIINPDKGEIEAYEVSKGFIDDLFEGRCILPYFTDHPMDGNVMIVSVEQAEQVERYNGGIKNFFYNKLD